MRSANGTIIFAAFIRASQVRYALRSGTGGFPYHQLRIEADVPGRQEGTRFIGEQRLHYQPPDLSPRNVNGRQRRTAVLGNRNVVEPSDRDISCNRETLVPKLANR